MSLHAALGWVHRALGFNGRLGLDGLVSPGCVGQQRKGKAKEDPQAVASGDKLRPLMQTASLTARATPSKCKFGEDCKFEHACENCGLSGHGRAECPTLAVV